MFAPALHCSKVKLEMGVFELMAASLLHPKTWNFGVMTSTQVSSPSPNESPAVTFFPITNLPDSKTSRE